MTTYSLIESGAIANTHVLGQTAYILKYGGQTYINPTAEHYEAAGWKLYVEPPAHPSHQVIDYSIVVEDVLTYTYGIRDKTAEELQADADAAEMETEIINNPLNNITFAEAAAYIDDNVTDLVSAKVAMRKMAKAILILNKLISVGE